MARASRARTSWPERATRAARSRRSRTSCSADAARTALERHWRAQKPCRPMPVRSPWQALLPLQFNEELAMPESATDHISTDFVVVHPVDPEDAAITTALRAMVSSTKGVARGIEARGPFDALMESVLPRDDVTFEEGALRGIPGMWVHPANGRSDEAILHLHGGWFNFGSAKAYRHLVGHIAARAGARVFIPDYRLAPEHPFPAATDDVLACYRGLAGSGVSRIALTGDSAGGNLALGLASRIAGASNRATLAGVAVLSPVTDLTLS